jgi:hypothetical protein
MLKPERKWVVGDRTFETYDKALSFVAEQRPLLQRQDLINSIASTIEKCPYGQADTTSAEDIADALLSAFTIKRKARK